METDFKTKRPRSKLYCFTWCPQHADMRDKTLYASQRLKGLAKVLTGTFDINANTLEDVKLAIGDKTVEDDAKSEESKESWMDDE